MVKYDKLGVFKALLASMVAQAGNEGLTRLWIGSLPIPGERALSSSGFLPALRLNSEVLSGMIWLRVRPAEGAEASLVEKAREVMAIANTPLRLGRSLRRSRPRRH